MKKRLLFISFVSLAFAGLINAQFSDIYDFKYPGKFGESPNGSLVSDGTYLYGMTYGGTFNKWGTIFKVKPDGTGADTLLTFNGTNGGSPDASGSLYYDGSFLYGATPYGGKDGDGVVFKIKPDGSGYSILHSFSGSPDGGTP